MRRVRILVLVAGLALGSACPRVDPPPEDAGVDAGTDAGEPLGIATPGTQLAFLVENAGRVEWLSAPSGTIAFDRVGIDGCSDVFTMNVDGTGVACLTCDHPDAPEPLTGYGNPAGHPGGRYVLMQGEKAVHDGARCGFGTGPGTAVYNDLVVLDRQEGSLTTLVESTGCPTCGASQPQLSRDGARLVWTELVTGSNLFIDGQEFGFTRLRIADVAELPGGGLTLSNVTSLEPNGTRWYAGHGFSPDGTRLIFTSSEAGLDVPTNTNLYTLRLADGHVEQLTVGGYHEHGHFAPDGRIAFAAGPDVLHTEWWLMAGDGTQRRPLSRFNEVGEKDWIAGDLAWDPAGGRFAGFVNSGFSANGYEALVYRVVP